MQAAVKAASHAGLDITATCKEVLNVRLALLEPFRSTWELQATSHAKCVMQESMLRWRGAHRAQAVHLESFLLKLDQQACIHALNARVEPTAKRMEAHLAQSVLLDTTLQKLARAAAHHAWNVQLESFLRM